FIDSTTTLEELEKIKSEIKNDDKESLNFFCAQVRKTKFNFLNTKESQFELELAESGHLKLKISNPVLKRLILLAKNSVIFDFKSIERTRAINKGQKDKKFAKDGQYETPIYDKEKDEFLFINFAGGEKGQLA